MIKANKKIDEIKKAREKKREDEVPPILNQLSTDEKQALKLRFSSSHYTQMEQRFPSGVQNMSEVEKQCFEFVSNLQFDFYSLNG